MSRYCFALALVLFSSSSIDAQERDQSEQRYVPFFVGVSTIPSNGWGVNSVIGQKQWLKYDFNATSLTTYEGIITGRRIPFKLGVNAQFENNPIGKIHRFAGYLGLKRTTLRIQTGSMQGDARWSGADIPTLPDTFSFDNKYVNIDLLYHPKKVGAFGYIGIGYTSMRLPIQLNTLITSGGRENQDYGAAVFDADFRVKMYSFLFGFDLINTEVFDLQQRKGFGVFIATQDKVGFGPGLVSEGAEDAAELMNPGRTSVGRNLFSGLVEYNLSLGPKYSFDIGRAKMIIAAGYEIAGATIFVFGGAASASSELGYDPSFNYWRYGFVFKAYLRFSSK